MIVRQGINRSVVLVGRWAVKLPWGLGHSPVRGWLSNRSEWRQRERSDVCPARWTLAHVVLVMPRADERGSLDSCFGLPPWLPGGEVYDGDEAKPDSWGRFGNRWLLIDYDRSWEQHDRGLIGSLYWGHQERLARRWADLPEA
jgi:hypothetical protein